MTAGEPRASERGFERLLERLLAPEATALRQVPFTVAFFVGLAVGLVAVDGHTAAPLWGGVVLVIAVQVAASVVPWRDLHPMAQIALPLGQMLALVLLEIGASQQTTLFTVLVFLPVFNLALLPSAWGVGVATLGSFLVVETVIWFDEETAQALVRTRWLIVPLAAFVLAAGVYGLMSRLRGSQAALAESDERLRGATGLWERLIDAVTGHAIIATDGDGRVEIFNPGAERLLGRTRADAVGMKVTEFHDPDAGVEAGEHEGTYVRRDGERVPVRVVAMRRPDLDGDGSGGYLFVATDITERGDARRLQDEFVGLVSDELRAPLVSVLGSLEQLRSDEDGLDEQQQEHVAASERNANRLLRLVNDLLLSVQLEAGTFTLTREDVDVAAVAYDWVRAMRPSTGVAGVSLQLDAPAPVWVRADSVRLGQVIEHLLSNAVKFSDRGDTVTLAVRSDHDASGRPTGVLSVADNGAGIGPDDLDRVTERFYRSRTARDRGIRGTGLGLSMVQAIVDAHDGELSVVSELGSGTTVTVLLPGADGA